MYRILKNRYEILAAMVTTMFVAVFVAPEAALAAAGVPCTSALSAPLKSATDQFFGAFIGLKSVYLVIIAACTIIGGLLIITNVGQKLVRYAVMLLAIGLLANVVIAFAHTTIGGAC